MKKIYAFARHNSGLILGLLMSPMVLFWAYSCQSTVVSLVKSDIKVNRRELLDEVEAFLAAAETRIVDLDRQDLVKDTIFNHAVLLLKGGTIDPAGIALVLGNLLGLGAVIDNVRKRTHINTLKGESLNAEVHKSLKEILKPSPN